MGPARLDTATPFMREHLLGSIRSGCSLPGTTVCFVCTLEEETTTMTDASLSPAVAALDLGPVVARARAAHGLTDDAAELAERLYRMFLDLRARFPDLSLVPPALADTIWHEHITDTRRYFDACERVAGGYIHHTPFEGEPDAHARAAWETTVRLFREIHDVDLFSLAAGGYRGGAPQSGASDAGTCGVAPMVEAGAPGTCGSAPQSKAAIPARTDIATARQDAARPGPCD
jgi:hypothetical protein